MASAPTPAPEGISAAWKSMFRNVFKTVESNFQYEWAYKCMGA